MQTGGVVLEPLHPLRLAISLGAGFVARGYSNESEHLSGLIVKGVERRGFALIDVLQPCVTFNRINTHEWYTKRGLDKVPPLTEAVTDDIDIGEILKDWE